MPYTILDRQTGHNYQCITCTGDVRWKNVHNVPPETIERMAARWEAL